MPDIQRTEPRADARITLPDGSVWTAPVGTPLVAFLEAAYPDLLPTVWDEPGSDMLIAAVVDGRLRELTMPVKRDVNVTPVMLSDPDGVRIYRRSLALLMLAAAYELHPGRKITIHHALPFGGYYCSASTPFTPDDIDAIRERMRAIVAEDRAITRREVPIAEAIDHYDARGDDDIVRVLTNVNRRHLTMYTLNGYSDTFHGYQVPSTAYLQVFGLTCDGDGFILHYPRRTEPMQIQPAVALPRLRTIYAETSRWLQLMDVADVGALNEAVRTGRTRELILVHEALHESRYADIADMIVERQPAVSLVLIAGPSSAGKTTSSKRLGVQLMAHGLRPFTLAMDDYFVNRADTPLDDKGEYDFEHLHALDLGLFNQHLNALMAGESVTLPHFNFHTGTRERGETVRLTGSHILIVEGIHGLNPELVRDVDPDRVFRMYVSCLTQLNIDRHNRIPTTDVRLLRRLVRDNQYRGYAAAETLGRWQSVRRGEKRWIFPYQENADVMFNSALVYELSVLRPLAEPLLRQLPPATSLEIEGKRLLSFLSWFEIIHDAEEFVPNNSILREFTGGSILRDYVPGHPGQEGAFIDPVGA